MAFKHERETDLLEVHFQEVLLLLLAFAQPEDLAATVTDRD